MFIRILFAIMLLNLPLNLFSIEKNILLKDLEFLGSVFEAKYAPKEWKAEYANWTLDGELQKAKEAILAKDEITVKDYHQILTSFFRNTRDFHVGIQFFSSEEAVLPFAISNVGNRFFVSDVDSTIITLMTALQLYSGDELKKGCEILTFDNKPIFRVVRDLKNNYVSNSKSLTAKQLACQLLTNRKGSFGHPMPKSKSAHISFKTPKGELCSAELGWHYIPEEVVYKSPYPDTEEGEENSFGYTAKMMYSPLAKAVMDSKEEVYKNYFAKIGVNMHLQASISSISDEISEFEDDDNDIETNSLADDPMQISYQANSLVLGRKIWKERDESLYQAYIYRSPVTKKKIGYIRVATYLPTTGEEEYVSLIKKLAKVINYFEMTTEGLVVDQTNNSGGSLLYGYAIAAMLTDRPLNTPFHQVTLTPKEVSNAIRDNKSIQFELAQRPENNKAPRQWMQGYAADRSFFKSYLAYNQFIINEWNNGKKITSNFPILGIKKIKPHPLGHYSKPILMLVDSLDFSTADFIPAILQDEKRAVIFGEKTAGAGGSVERCSYPNLLGVASLSFTTSFAERANRKAIENLGITPNIPYTKTVEDMIGNNKDYKKAINAAVEDLLAP